MTHRRAAAAPRRAVTVYADKAMAERVALARASATVATEVVAERGGWAVRSTPKPPPPRLAPKPRPRAPAAVAAAFETGPAIDAAAGDRRAARKKES